MEFLTGVRINMRFSSVYCEKVMSFMGSHKGKFVDRSRGQGQVRSSNRVANLSTLYDYDMSPELLEAVFSEVPEEWRYDVQEIQIQRYAEGGSICLHKEGPSISFLDLSVLYSESPSYLYVLDKISKRWSKIEDDIGYIRRIDPDVYHCVPKTSSLRYSIVFVRYITYDKGFTYVRCF